MILRGVPRGKSMHRLIKTLSIFSFEKGGHFIMIMMGIKLKVSFLEGSWNLNCAYNYLIPFKSHRLLKPYT